MELVRSTGSSIEGNVIAKLSKNHDWNNIFGSNSSYDEVVTRYIYELQCFVLECSAVAERHKVVVVEQTAKIHCLEAYLEGKINMLDWNQFDCINFQPLTFSFPPAPSGRPSAKVLKYESREVTSYIDVLETQACKSMAQMEALAQELKIFSDLVEKLNEEVWSLDVSGEIERPMPITQATAAQKKRRRISLLRLHPSKTFPFLTLLNRK